MTPKIHVWQLPIAITLRMITFVLLFGGFIWIMGLAVSEESCFDRWPW